MLLPSLSSAYAKGNEVRYNALLDHGLRLVVLVGVPAAVGLWLTAELLVSFLFQGRSFTPTDVHQTAIAVVGYAVGLIGLIGLKIIAPAFYARKDIRTPVRAAMASLVAVQAINLVVVPLLRMRAWRSPSVWGASSTAAFCFCVLRRRGIYSPAAGWLKIWLRTAAAVALMGAAVWWGQQGIDWTTLSWKMRGLGVCAVVAGAAVIYFGSLLLWGGVLENSAP